MLEDVDRFRASQDIDLHGNGDLVPRLGARRDEHVAAAAGQPFHDGFGVLGVIEDKQPRSAVMQLAVNRLAHRCQWRT